MFNEQEKVMMENFVKTFAPKYDSMKRSTDAEYRCPCGGTCSGDCTGDCSGSTTCTLIF